MSGQTAPRSGGAARRRPNDSIGVDRAANQPNDSVETPGPWRTWPGGRGLPTRERAGAQAPL